MATEAATTLDWFEITSVSDNVTETHTPALNDDDMWDWDSAVLYPGRSKD